MPESTVHAFVDRFQVPWHCGYGAHEAIDRLGALKHDSTIRGYEVQPTLWLIDSQGAVRWCDGQARMRHQGTKSQLAVLEEQIERALASDHKATGE